MDKNTVALFDFDGTLTLRDTLPLYIRHATGLTGLLHSIFVTFPSLVVLACAGWKSVWGIDAHSTKERLLKRCFAGKTIEQVDSTARSFIPVISSVIAPQVLNRMQWHIAHGHRVVIVSASPAVWVEPWAMAHGCHSVIATQLAVCNGKYTGLFQGNNCNGEEKVQRIAHTYPRSQYHIIAYGNSSGDIPMLLYAHEAYMCNNGKLTPYNHEP